MNETASGFGEKRAPILLIWNALAPVLCRELVEYSAAALPNYGSDGFTSKGHDLAADDFQVRHDGPYGVMTETLLKRPRWLGVLEPWLKRQVLPLIHARYLGQRVLGHEPWRLARYDAPRGHIAPHRDNPTPQTAHRNFTMTVNLNAGQYQGGELVFSEYDDGRCAVEAGTAVVWPARLLHEVLPVTKGTRVVLGVHLCARTPTVSR